MDNEQPHQDAQKQQPDLHAPETKQAVPPVDQHHQLPAAKPPFLRENLLPWVIALGAVAVGIVIFLFVRQFFVSAPDPVAPTPTPTMTPTPTPVRPLSNIATSSSFLILEESVASLSAEVSVYRVDDPALTPPDLTLPLGFPD